MMTRFSQLDIDLDMKQKAAILKSYSEHNPGEIPALVFIESNKNYRVLGYDAYIVAGILKMDPEFFPYQVDNNVIQLPVLDIIEPLVGQALEQVGYELDRPILLPWDERFDSDTVDQSDFEEHPSFWNA